jgi:hypothetical protein
MLLLDMRTVDAMRSAGAAVECTDCGSCRVPWDMPIGTCQVSLLTESENSVVAAMIQNKRSNTWFGL